MKVVVALTLLAAAQTALALDNGLGRTPMMGYNTWNAFKFGINETLMKQTADLMVSLGLKDAGYHYVALDDGWALSNRTGNQPIESNPVLFPNGMKALGDYVHAKGMKFGIYGDAGTATCGLFTGSLGFEAMDAAQFAYWGVDLLKYDNCHAPGSDIVSAEQRYSVMHFALNATGRPIAFCMCDWGSSSAWTYGPAVGNSWRTSQDIAPGWDSVMTNLDATVGLSRYAGPGGWNDADMLEIGPQGKLSTTEASAHMALWAILKSPLIIGADLSALDNETLAILTAPEVIAVNQDPLGVAGDLVWKQGPAEVYAATLSGGGRAVVMLNRHFLSLHPSGTHNMTVHWKTIGIPSADMATVRDMYRRKDLGVFQGLFTGAVLVHGVLALKITPLRQAVRPDVWRPWTCDLDMGLACPLARASASV